MEKGNWTFRPGLLPTLVTLALEVLLINLGLWQLDRAAQKEQLLAQFEQRGEDASVAITGELLDFAGLEFQPATVQGSFDGDHQFLLDNRTHKGLAGYQVLTPLRISGSDKAVLVNRGWVPQGMTRQDLPALPVSEGPVQLDGLIRQPPWAYTLGEGEDQAPGWPKVLQQIRFELQSQQLGYELLPVTVLLDPAAEDGFVRDWRPVTFGPERNRGYAVQWFSLAAALLVIYLLVNVKRVK